MSNKINKQQLNRNNKLKITFSDEYINNLNIQEAYKIELKRIINNLNDLSTIRAQMKLLNNLPMFNFSTKKNKILFFSLIFNLSFNNAKYYFYSEDNEIGRKNYTWI